MEEVWRDIKGFEGKYEVSNYGRVRNKKTGKILKPFIQQDYLRFSLCGVKKLGARLVAEAFITNPNNLPVINHKDRVRSNNFVWVNEDGTIDQEKSNLEWSSIRDNVIYPPTQTQRIKTILENGKKRRKVLKIDILTNEVIKEYPSEKEAAIDNNLSKGNLCCVLKHYYGRKTTGGFRWEYASI